MPRVSRPLAFAAALIGGAAPLAWGGGPWFAAPMTCSTSSASVGCPPGYDESRAAFTGDGLVLTDLQIRGGTSGSQPSASGTTSTSPVAALRPNQRALRCNNYLAECLDDPIAPTPAAGQAPITIADLASFTPAVGELIVQPENWGVLGVPTNFVATATDHVQDGTLLGQPVQVRWRPVAFTFDYGDGTVVSTDDPGASWQTDDDAWTTTATSHDYQARGGFTATVTITFEADISSGADWTTVPGTLDLAAPAEAVQIFEVQTVLTRGDCIDYPDDPGCAP